MLLLARQMHGASVEASDGKIGKLCDLLFDEQDWSIRYLVLDGGTWLNRRRVTLPPDLVRRRDWADHRLSVAGLTRRQVMESPNVETHVLRFSERFSPTEKIVSAQIFDSDNRPIASCKLSIYVATAKIRH